MQLSTHRPMIASRPARSAQHRMRGFAKLLTALALLLAVAGLEACGTDTGQETAPTPLADGAIPATMSLPDVIAANGVLLPVRRVTVSFSTAGSVASLTAEVGAQVYAGETLTTLDASDLQQAVVQATLNLESAQHHLAVVQAQPVTERVLAATYTISSAQTSLAQAEAIAGQRSNQAILDRAALTQAGQALRDAESAYHQLLDSSVTRDWAPHSPAAKALEDAQERYRLTFAEYSLHTADRSPEVNIAVAEAQLAQARWSLHEAQVPVAPEVVALAELEVRHAAHALGQAEAMLERASITAPFDGIIAAVHTQPGQWVQAGTPAIEILDFSRWRIETKNIGELAIGQVRVGQPATAHINAFRDTELQGRVITIQPVAVVQQGDTTYTVMIELQPTDLNLRPGMTAQVQIEVAN